MKKKTENNVKKVYSFAVPGLYKGFTAEEAANELERIRQQYGTLDPEHIVQESVAPDSLFHNVFEWNDTEAARKFRETQASNLIRNIKVEIVRNTISYNVRAYVNVRENKDSARSYTPIEQAIVNDTSYKDLLEQSKGEMESFVTKYAQINELNAVKLEMLKAISAIQTK